MRKFDIIVVGAGSGGIGAAWSAASIGANVLLIDKSPSLGGTFTRAGVCCWEASISGTGLSEIIYHNAEKHKNAVDIYPDIWEKKNYDLTLKVNGLDLNDRIGKDIKGRYGVIIEPEIYSGVVADLLADVGCRHIWYNSELVEVITRDKRVKSLLIYVNGKICEVSADFFIDATGSITLAEKAGCEITFGQESRAVYNEESAPEFGDPEKINGASLIFRISKNPKKTLKRSESEINSQQEISPVTLFFQRFPNGDMYVNPLPTLTGKELSNIPGKDVYKFAVSKTWAIWDLMKNKYPEVSNYHICWLAPELGVREGKRIISEYVLTQNDIIAGLENHKYKDIVAVADHMFDMHGVLLKNKQLLKEPYGIPLRTMIPQGWRNLFVACRGAGFSQIAASSCRLSRTIMQLGQAAGTAAALAINEGVPIPDINYLLLRRRIEMQGIVLDKKILEQRYYEAFEKSGANKKITTMKGKL